MIPNDYLNSIRVASQLPDFVRDDLDYETFVAFVKSYYEWLELANTANANTTIVSSTTQGVTTGIKNLTNYFDVDNTLDSFIEYFLQEFLPNFPENSLADQAKTLKIARQIYEKKGTPSSYELLFRLLYNSWVGILENTDLVFRPSDGHWFIPKYLQVTSDNNRLLTANLKGLYAFGITSKAYAVIDTVTYSNGAYQIYTSSTNRSFTSGETIRIIDRFDNNVYSNNLQLVASTANDASVIEGTLVGTVNGVTIVPDRKGLNYSVGDPVVIYGGLSDSVTTGAKAQVSDVTSGSIQKIDVLTGGHGYQKGNQTIANTLYQNTSIIITPTNGAIGNVTVFDESNVAVVDYVVTDLIGPSANVLIGAEAYTFLANTGANFEGKFSEAFGFASFNTYPIVFVSLDSPGSNFNTAPTIAAQSNYYAGNTVQNLASYGILGPIEILNGGLNYQVGDVITITGGSGAGANANVASVNGSGGITAVQYLNYIVNDSGGTELYPRGGFGYKTSDLDSLSLSVKSASGAGASFRVNNILGTGATFSASTDRAGSIRSIVVTDPGEAYISNPSVSLKVMELAANGIQGTGTLNSILPGSLITQGALNNYIGYVDSFSLLELGGSFADSIYSIRVYNYYGTPAYYDPSDSANTMIKINGVASMNLTTFSGYTNGVKLYGDGTAKATASFTSGARTGQGSYINIKGQPSAYSFLQSRDINDYTYQLSVEAPIALYRDTLKKLLHPAGTNVVGREVLNSQKSFSVTSQSTLANSYPLSHFDADANVTFIADFDNYSNNLVVVKNIDMPTFNIAFSPNQRFFCARNGMNVYNKILQVYPGNTSVRLYTDYILTYPNVAYGYAATGTNTINITSNTDTYGRFINNNEWRYPGANTNPMREIVFVGDKLKMDGNVYTVSNVYYGDTSSETVITLTTNVGYNVGNSSYPVLISINRNVVNDSNVIIYTIN